jgi:hypothetical protein
MTLRIALVGASPVVTSVASGFFVTSSGLIRRAVTTTARPAATSLHCRNTSPANWTWGTRVNTGA